MDFFTKYKYRMLCFGFVVISMVLIFFMTSVEDRSLDKQSKRHVFYEMIEKTSVLREKISHALLLKEHEISFSIDNSQTANISDYTEVLDGGQIVMYDIEHKMIVILVPEIQSDFTKWKCQGSDSSIFPKWCIDGMKL